MIFRMTDGAQLERWIREKARGAQRSAVLLAANRVVQAITAEIIPNIDPPPVDTRQYAGGWRVVPSETKITISNSTPQAAFIEKGVRAANVKPGRLMIDALAKWAHRKGIGEGGDGRGIAWAIARNMQKRGIFAGGRGHHVLARGMDRFAAFLKDEYPRALRQEMKKG